MPRCSSRLVPAHRSMRARRGRADARRRPRRASRAHDGTRDYCYQALSAAGRARVAFAAAGMQDPILRRGQRLGSVVVYLRPSAAQLCDRISTCETARSIRHHCLSGSTKAWCAMRTATGVGGTLTACKTHLSARYRVPDCANTRTRGQGSGVASRSTPTVIYQYAPFSCSRRFCGVSDSSGGLQYAFTRAAALP